MAYQDAYAEVSSTSRTSGTHDQVNEDYAEVLRSLLPEGPAWTFTDGSTMFSLLRALSYSFARVVARGRDLIEEMDPRTTTELLPDWERVLGLPGDCPSPPTTLAGRRGAVWAKLLGNDSPTPQHFVAIAAAVGYTATVTEYAKDVHEPFTCISDCNYSLWQAGAGWPFYWFVTTTHGANDALLTWLIDSMAPNHTVVDVIFT